MRQSDSSCLFQIKCDFMTFSAGAGEQTAASFLVGSCSSEAEARLREIFQ